MVNVHVDVKRFILLLYDTDLIKPKLAWLKFFPFKNVYVIVTFKRD